MRFFGKKRKGENVNEIIQKNPLVDEENDQNDQGSTKLSQADVITTLVHSTNRNIADNKELEDEGDMDDLQDNKNDENYDDDYDKAHGIKYDSNKDDFGKQIAGLKKR